MAVLSRKAFPERHDLIVGVVTKIRKHGVYIRLKEFNDIVGYCHIGEVAGAWIRNIRNFVRIDQEVIAKVLRVDEKTRQVDLSIKRVSDQLKKDKRQEYKRQNSALAMTKLIADKYGKSVEEIREIIEDKMTQVYGSLYDGFEEMVAVGMEAVNDFKFPSKLNEIMLDIAEASIQISMVVISATLGIRSFASDGVLQVKQLLQAAEEEFNDNPEVSGEVTSIGAPSYRLHLEGYSYPEVNDVYISIEKALAKKKQELDLEYKIVRDEN
ncbi:MAG: S1 RNA-binding domain-containing protein [Chloroflexi bacterium]|nr:S1 RNA-binding domain-containing protein [Chloroflexota bacterium]